MGVRVVGRMCRKKKGKPTRETRELNDYKGARSDSLFEQFHDVHDLCVVVVGGYSFTASFNIRSPLSTRYSFFFFFWPSLPLGGGVCVWASRKCLERCREGLGKGKVCVIAFGLYVRVRVN